MLLELRLPVFGTRFPVDHQYAKYASLSKQVPAIHDDNARVQIGPINGEYMGKGLNRVVPHRSYLPIRLMPEEIPNFVRLAGKTLNLGNYRIRLGLPHVQALRPSGTLLARMVTIKGFTEKGSFLDACRRQLDELDVKCDPNIPQVVEGNHQGKSRRQVLRIKDKLIVGFSLQLEGLSDEDSLLIQQKGIGGRRKMGCGFFVPIRSN